MNIEELMRVGHVKRWHIVRVGREQTISEHMHRVWLICREIGLGMNLDGQETKALEEAALHHDIPEIIMGDIPSPTKQRIEEDTDCLEGMERECGYGASFKLNSRLACILKMADLMEAIHFLREEGIGKHASQVQGWLDAQFWRVWEKATDDHKCDDWGVVRDIYLLLCA